MPRPTSENTEQVTLKIPASAMSDAEAVAEAMSQPLLRVSRTEVIRIAIVRGLAELATEYGGRKRPPATKPTKKPTKKGARRHAS